MEYLLVIGRVNVRQTEVARLSHHERHWFVIHDTEGNIPAMGRRTNCIRGSTALHTYIDIQNDT